MNTVKWIHIACVSKWTLCYNHNENTFFTITPRSFPTLLTPTLAVSCYLVTSLGNFTVDATVFPAVNTVTVTRTDRITIMCTVVTTVKTATVRVIALPTIAAVCIRICTIWTKRIVSAFFKEKKKTTIENHWNLIFVAFLWNDYMHMFSSIEKHTNFDHIFALCIHLSMSDMFRLCRHIDPADSCQDKVKDSLRL